MQWFIFGNIDVHTFQVYIKRHLWFYSSIYVFKPVSMLFLPVFAKLRVDVSVLCLLPSFCAGQLTALCLSVKSVWRWPEWIHSLAFYPWVGKCFIKFFDKSFQRYFHIYTWYFKLFELYVMWCITVSDCQSNYKIYS